MKFLIVELLHSPFSSLLGLNIRLRILFSNILSLRSSIKIVSRLSKQFFGIFSVFVVISPFNRLYGMCEVIIIYNACNFAPVSGI